MDIEFALGQPQSKYAVNNPTTNSLPTYTEQNTIFTCNSNTNYSRFIYSVLGVDKVVEKEWN
jgi:hypothetical protein